MLGEIYTIFESSLSIPSEKEAEGDVNRKDNLQMQQGSWENHSG